MFELKENKTREIGKIKSSCNYSKIPPENTFTKSLNNLILNRNSLLNRKTLIYERYKI